MLIHNNKPIPGTHEAILPQAPELQTSRTKFFGVVGTSEIRGEAGGRFLVTDIWIHNNFGAAALTAFLQDLDRRVGEHGDLQITTTPFPRVYKHCTFEGFSRDPLGPMPDLAGTVPGFWCRGVLRFFQQTVVE